MANGPHDRATIDLASSVLTELLHRHVPGLVVGLHLVGSAADGDFQSGRSDLDFVAVLSHLATNDDIEALVIVHRLYASDPTLPLLDGIWITEGDLAAGPDAAEAGPTTHANSFVEIAQGNRNPITWFALRDNSVPLVGALDRVTLWHDAKRLASWTRENVESYWAPWHTRSSQMISGSGLAMLGTAAPMWGVLGISRLHCTLATGRIASKTAAGEYALQAFDARWERIVRECLRIRGGKGRPLYANPFVRRGDVLDFVAMVIETIQKGHFASE